MTTIRGLIIVLALALPSPLWAAAQMTLPGTVTVDGIISPGEWDAADLEFDTGPRPCDPANLGAWDLSGARGRFLWDDTNVYALFESYPNTCGPGANPNGPFAAINIELYVNAMGSTAYFLSECPDFDENCGNGFGRTVRWSPDFSLIEVSIPVSAIVDFSTPKIFDPPGDFLEYRVRIGDPDSAGGFDSRDQTAGWIVEPPETSGGFRRLDFQQSCVLDQDCDDGLACNGTETCDIGSGLCQAGTPPIDCTGDPCLTGFCLEPSATCQPVADGTPCETGQDTCSASDACQAGACANSGGGGDPDADLLCSVDDNCPGDANPGQEDADSDGTGDACDLTFDPGGSGLSVGRVVVREASTPVRSAWKMRGELDVAGSDTFEADVVAGGVRIELFSTPGGTDASVNAFSFGPGACEVNRRGVIRCRDQGTLSSARFRPRFAPDFYLVSVRIRGQDLSAPAVADTPLAVVLGPLPSGPDRRDEITGCRGRATAIRCRERR